MRSVTLVVAALFLLGCPPLTAQTTFTVNSTNDMDDGTCDATHCSFREAINAANANFGADNIAFNISGAGPHTIQPLFALPTITDPVVIDGTTEPDFAGTPIIELDGTNAGIVHGLSITTGNSTVLGLVINRFGLNGVLITGAGATGNVIEGNFIGTDVTGTSSLGNGLHGVSIVDAPNNTVGGTTSAARNVISGNSAFGVEIIFAGSTGNLVQGNYIGTDVNGAVALSNSEGVFIDAAPNNTIGGTTAGARNVISGNTNNGASINGSGATGNLVQGNYIGTDPTGTAALGNGNAGVLVGNVGNAANNTIGGTTAGARNVISGNFEGVTIVDDGLGAGGNVVQGNYIGTDVTGTSAIGNVVGVLLLASGNTIGGTSTGAGNTIAFSTNLGVKMDRGTGNAILSNSIFSNGDLGIDLGADGLTANDAGDGDTGANNLQNFPVLTSAFKGSTTIEGTLNSTPSATFTLEFFSNSACDPFGHGEGESLLGSTVVTTDGGGDASFMVPFPTDLPTGTVITATATDPSNNTSEFSQCATVADFTIAVAPASVTVVRGEAATYTVTVSSEGGTFNGDVSLSCTGLPAQTSCSFAPGTVTPGASAVTSTLTVSTTAPSALLAPPLGERELPPMFALWLERLALGFFGLVLVGVVLGGRASKRRRLGLYWPLALALLVTLTLSAGCGGEITSPGTPFTFTITGTSGSLEHSTTATLIVP